MEILTFFMGVLFFYVPSFYILLFLVISLYLKVNWKILIWFIAALAWSGLHAWWVSDEQMPDSRVIPKALLVGEVTSMPLTGKGKTQFEFSLSSLNGNRVKATVLLSCYTHCPTFQPGEVWRLETKLKRPENMGNPGHFDYLGMLNARHIHWTGYIKGKNYHRMRPAATSFDVLGLRTKLADELKQMFSSEKTLGIVQALTLGVTNHIDTASWDLFRRTGTTHLMVISGSHITLVAGLAFGLIYSIWPFWGRLCLYRPAVQPAAIVALLMALFYSVLSGFAVPAQRALFAFFLFLSRHFLSFQITVWQAWRYALLLVLLVEPHAVLLSGFYLSFIAVAILVSANQRFPYKGFMKAMALQLTVLFGLMPFTLFWFSYGAVNGFFANLLAIPLVGYVIVPLALLCLFVIHLTHLSILVLPLEYAVNGLMVYLKWIDHFAEVNLTVSLVSVLAMLSLTIALGVVVFFPIRSCFPAMILLFVTPWFPSYPRVAEGEAVVDVLDVGQGLSVVVKTAKHTLIYDTGMKFYQGSDMAQLAIIPYLVSTGIKTIDRVVISHPDLDHRGGLASLEQQYDIRSLLVDKVKFYHKGSNCHRYSEWNWEGVSFRFLPIHLRFRDKNNSSCVLQIKTKGGSVLLPGDIEQPAEQYLVNTYPNELATDVIILPHHGSKTSSSYSFIEKVAPQYAIISAGFDNRFHFPHEKTLSTMATFGIKILNTMDCGMVSIRLDDKPVLKPSCYRH